MGNQASTRDFFCQVLFLLLCGLKVNFQLPIKKNTNTLYTNTNANTNTQSNCHPIKHPPEISSARCFFAFVWIKSQFPITNKKKHKHIIYRYKCKYKHTKQ